MFSFKNKKKKEFEKEHLEKIKYVDNFIYFFLVIFIVFCIGFNLNYLQTVFIAIFFTTLIAFVYIMKFKFKNKFFLKDSCLDIVDNLTIEGLKKYSLIYYEKILNYKVLNEKNMIIEKNNHKYAVKFFIDKLDFSTIKGLNKSKNVDGLIIITNITPDKKTLDLIKEKNFFSITRAGVLNIIKNIESL